MKSNTKISLSISIGAIVVAATLAIFFLGDSISAKTSLDWLSLAFIILSEIALFAGTTIMSMQVSPTNKILIHSGITSTLVIYWLITLVGAFFKDIFKDNLNGYIILQVIIIAITAIIILSLNSIATRVGNMDASIEHSRGLMDECQKRLFGLKSNDAYIEYQEPLNDLYEMLKYGDKIGSTTVDSEIANEIAILEKSLANKETSLTSTTDTLVDSIRFLIKQRNMELSQAKRGSF
ncbi:hypothetical protein Desor_5159 [Desulfosporosinus orientis DSM 765]|uniref:Uncharacterized protein n=1 Tax=Desulfosporosinus orientis (strain ATCC 19365 / DSM 765 / NCIMB 8382 / VKM B-1628 / Singapore I) TaxID=768706 RepID=G7W740_DESOD|nr:hypothetical protein [Desulfosporosinus orientis]AET70548.1 hypothetical protein Desor_5159 [Desulfosporosinus orientis DSM 765]